MSDRAGTPTRLAILSTIGSAVHLFWCSFLNVCSDLGNLLVPGLCRYCDGPLIYTGEVPMCLDCRRNIAPDEIFVCQCCSEALELDLNLEDVRFASMRAEGFLCRTCRASEPSFDRVCAFATYRRELRVLIHLFKFTRVRSVVRLLLPGLVHSFLQLRQRGQAECLVIAVPLFEERERERGFNQSILLADAAVKRLRRTHPGWQLRTSHSLLARQRRTEAQWTLSAKGRRRNLRGAFVAEPGVEGKEIILVDDILTTGATARECARVLKGAGATRVWVAVVARAQKIEVERFRKDPAEEVAAWDLNPGVLGATGTLAAVLQQTGKSTSP